MALEISVGNWKGRKEWGVLGDRKQGTALLRQVTVVGGRVGGMASSPQEMGGSVALGTWIGYQKVLTSAKEVCLLSVVRAC